MTKTRSLPCIRGFIVTLCLGLLSGAAHAQTAAPAATTTAIPKAAGYSMLSGAAASLSNSGNSTVGFGASWGEAVNAVVIGVDGVMYSQNGFKSYSGLVYGGYGFGPYRDDRLAADNANKSVVFAVVGGMYSAFSTANSDSHPFAGATIMAPLGGALLTKVTAGYVFAGTTNTLYFNLGFGFKL